MASNVGSVLATSLALIATPPKEDIDTQLRKIFTITGKTLGKGSYGSVFAGIDGRTLSPVAIKQQKLGDAAEIETGTLRLLQGVPHVVRCRAAFLGSPKQNPAQQKHHLVMDLLPGDNVFNTFVLAKKASDKLTFNEITTIAHQLIETLYQFEVNGIIYFDLKPDNFNFRRASRSLTMFDFGGARDTQDKEVHPITTPNYWSPEFILYKSVTPAYDLWSFACTLYLLLTDKHLFHIPPEVQQEKRGSYLLQLIVQQLGKPTSEYLRNSPVAAQIFDPNLEFRHKELLPPMKKWQEVVREAGRRKSWPAEEVEMFIGLIDSVLRYENRASPLELLKSPLFEKEISVDLEYLTAPKCKVHIQRVSKLAKSFAELTPSDLAPDLTIDLSQAPDTCLHIPRDPNDNYIVTLEKNGVLLPGILTLKDASVMSICNLQKTLEKHAVKAKRDLTVDLEKAADEPTPVKKAKNETQPQRPAAAVAVDPALQKLEQEIENQISELEAAEVTIPPIDAVSSSTDAWMRKVFQ